MLGEQKEVTMPGTVGRVVMGVGKGARTFRTW
jgi:hypothetical protein